MNNRPLTAEEVKQLLGINDFSDIGEDQIHVFVSEIPKMDRDVAISAIEQFPAYGELVKALAEQFFTLSEKVSDANSSSVQRVLDAYGQTLNMMSALAQRENIRSEERQWFAEQAVEIADKMADVDHENKNFLVEVLKTGAKVVGSVAVVCLAFLGFSFLNSNDD